MNILVIALVVGGSLALLFLLIFFIRSWLYTRHLVREFRACNVIVAGKKGTGKDLLFQHIINKRKEPYYSNIDYGGKCEIVRLKEVSADPNDFRHFIEGNIRQIDRRFEEKRDIYISDGGVFLPSFADTLLDKVYPSMPVYYALSRHSAEHNIHVNVQNFERVWKKLREQADSYVLVKGRIKLPHFILVKSIWYDKLQSAMQALEPVKTRLLNKFSKAEVDIYKATNGNIKVGWCIIPKRKIKYDTRAFEKVLYGDQPRIYPGDAEGCPPHGKREAVADSPKSETEKEESAAV